MQKKIVWAALVVLFIAGVAVCGCTSTPEVTKGERAQMLDSQKTPTLKTSNERDIFMGYLQQTSDPNNIQWVYCMDYSGHVIFRSAVKGKVISATKSSEPYERMVPSDYDTSSWTYTKEENAANSFAGYIAGTNQLMNPSGMFGHDTPGCIWMSPDGQYYEWHGGPYFVSDKPLKLQNPVLSYENIDYDEMAKYAVNKT